MVTSKLLRKVRKEHKHEYDESTLDRFCVVAT